MNDITPTDEPTETTPPRHVSQNIDTVAALMQRAERNINIHQRTVERATALIGRPSFVMFVTALIVSWVGVNVGAKLLHITPFDRPPFPWLQAIISLGALYTTLVVAGTQNRQGKVMEQRDNLELQAILLTEQKATKIIALLEELRRDLPNVTNRADTEAEALQEALDATAVVAALEKSEETSLQPAAE